MLTVRGFWRGTPKTRHKYYNGDPQKGIPGHTEEVPIIQSVSGNSIHVVNDQWILVDSLEKDFKWLLVHVETGCVFGCLARKTAAKGIIKEFASIQYNGEKEKDYDGPNKTTIRRRVHEFTVILKNGNIMTFNSHLQYTIEGLLQ